MAKKSKRNRVLKIFIKNQFLKFILILKFLPYLNPSSRYYLWKSSFTPHPSCFIFSTGLMLIERNHIR